MPRKPSKFQQWLRIFRETGHASHIGVLPQPSRDASDEDLRKLWENSAPVRRFWRRATKPTTQEREVKRIDAVN